MTKTNNENNNKKENKNILYKFYRNIVTRFLCFKLNKRYPNSNKIRRSNSFNNTSKNTNKSTNPSINPFNKNLYKNIKRIISSNYNNYKKPKIRLKTKYILK